VRADCRVSRAHRTQRIQEPPAAADRRRSRPRSAAGPLAVTSTSSIHVPPIRVAQQISLIAAVALIAGCGGSAAPQSGSTSSSPPASARPSANTTSTASSAARGLSPHAQLVGFARAVNLRAQDAPGFTVAPRRGKTRSRNNASENESLGRCLGVAKEVKPVVKLGSSKFQIGTSLHTNAVSSSVSIAPSLAIARREVHEAKQVLKSPTAARCFTRLFDSLYPQGQAIHVPHATVHVRLGNVHIAPIATSDAARGTDGSVGLSMKVGVRYVVSAHGRTVTVPSSLELDELAFLVGRAGVTLTTSGLGASFPPELEASAFSQLVTRALAAARTYPDVKR
jgi:hypothetical protein